MLLYRAINEDDLKHIIDNNDIFCSLHNSVCAQKNKTGKPKNSYLYTYYKLCLQLKREYALDTIASHVSGNRVRVGLSPWISTTSSFDFAASEYAVPQTGRYNVYKKRKPIIVIDMPDNDIKRESNEIMNLRDRVDQYDFAIDLRNNNLDTLYNVGAVSAEKYNKDMPGYDPGDIDTINNEINGYKTSVNGFSNYSTAANEVLFFGRIRRENIKLIISPLLQDVLYSCNIDVSRSYGFIASNIEKLQNTINDVDKYLNDEDKKLFLELYSNDMMADNLTDYLIKYYNNIYGNTIEEKYEYLKKRKIILLNEIVNKINSEFNVNLKVSRLVDDGLIVSDYYNISNLSKYSKYDLILIEKDNLLYTYDYDKRGYANDDTGDVIIQKEILKNIDTKKKCLKR